MLIDPNTHLTPNPEQKQCQNTLLAVAPVPSYSLLTQVMLISILINAHYLHNVVFSFENGQNGENQSLSDSKHPSKIPHQNLQSSHRGTSSSLLQYCICTCQHTCHKFNVCKKQQVPLLFMKLIVQAFGMKKRKIKNIKLNS